MLRFHSRSFQAQITSSFTVVANNNKADIFYAAIQIALKFYILSTQSHWKRTLFTFQALSTTNQRSFLLLIHFHFDMEWRKLNIQCKAVALKMWLKSESTFRSLLNQAFATWIPVQWYMWFFGTFWGFSGDFSWKIRFFFNFAKSFAENDFRVRNFFHKKFSLE